LEEKGKVRLGVVFDPLRNELFTALKGKGAFLNGAKITTSEQSNLSGALLVTGFPYDVKQNRKNFQYFRRFVLNAQAVRRDGSAALDLCYTAMGRFDGFWEFSLSPWDLAAGSLILKEAGGKITLSSGRPFSIYKGEVLASNGPIHSQMVRVLKG
jgi:myo-inositol-1(or 4)-monophosphatase